MTTLDELALGVLLPSFPQPVASAELLGLFEEGLGGVCLFGTTTSAGLAAVESYTSAVRSVRPDIVIAIDEEGGDVTRLHSTTGSPVPAPLALGLGGDLDVTRTAGRMVGLELASLGVTLGLAPVGDVNSTPENPVIGTRSFGTDAAVVAAHTAAWIDGLQSAGVAACVKHFPGHGDARTDSHLELPSIDADGAQLRRRELVPFTSAVRAGVSAVMTAHIVTPAIDPAAAATLSAATIRVLREEIGFDGAVVSDALDMAALGGRSAMPDSAVRALAAGVDLLCLGPDTGVELLRAVQAAIVRSVLDGRLSDERLHSAASAVRSLRPRTTSAPTTGASAGRDDAEEAMRTAARSAVTVSGVLPALHGATVVRVDTDATPAWEPAPWGLPADDVVRPGEPLPPSWPLVIQVRDASRQPAVLRTLRTAPRDAVVVEWGWPGHLPDTLPTVRSHGWSRPSAQAVREVLEDAGWDG